MKKHVIVLMDGVADRADVHGKTPLEQAYTPNMDEIASVGFSGLMKTLYDDLPKGSIVAQLGMLGYDPYLYYPFGRASCEAMALDVELNKDDIAFRANLSTVNNGLLESYNAQYIKSCESRVLVDRINALLKERYPSFELYHNSDFRNVLVIRDAGVHPLEIECLSPHEHMGKPVAVENLIKARDEKASGFVARLNQYLCEVSGVLADESANVLIPWSPSLRLCLPLFSLLQHGKCAIISNMDFLQGIAKKIGIEYFDVGTGSWDTEYGVKGEKIRTLLEDGYYFIICHINGPDEASHMGLMEKKIFSIEQIDEHIVSQPLHYFKEHPGELGSLVVTTDHYTITQPSAFRNGFESHTDTPVPFAIWDALRKDEVVRFSEQAAADGLFGGDVVNHMDFFHVMGVI